MLSPPSLPAYADRRGRPSIPCTLTHDPTHGSRVHKCAPAYSLLTPIPTYLPARLERGVAVDTQAVARGAVAHKRYLQASHAQQQKSCMLA